MDEVEFVLQYLCESGRLREQLNPTMPGTDEKLLGLATDIRAAMPKNLPGGALHMIGKLQADLNRANATIDALLKTQR